MSKAIGKKDKLTARRRAALSPPERLDIAALEALGPLLRRRWSRRLGALGNLADEPPLLALSVTTGLAGVLGGNRALRRASGRMLLAHALATALKTLGKNRIDRSRPDALLDKARYRMAWGRSRKAALRSFPSGHTAGAFALAGAFAREVPRARAPAYLAAGILGALQVLRHAHFPGDVAAGAVLGLAAKAAGNAAIDGLAATSRTARSLLPRSAAASLAAAAPTT